MLKKSILSIPLIMLLPVCAGGQMPTLSDMASMAIDIRKGSYRDIDLAVGKGFDRAALKKFDRVAFIVRRGDDVYLAPGGSAVFADNLAKEFLRMGFDVAEREILQEMMEEMKFQRGVYASNKNIAKIGKMVGVKGIFKGSFQTGTHSGGSSLWSSGEATQGITSASLRLVDIETTKVAVVITADFKTPKSPTDVAEDIAKAFSKFSEPERTAEEDDAEGAEAEETGKKKKRKFGISLPW